MRLNYSGSADVATVQATVTVCVTNARALKALARVVQFVAEEADQRPYSPDAQRAKRAAKYVLRNLGLAGGQKPCR